MAVIAIQQENDTNMRVTAMHTADRVNQAIVVEGSIPQQDYIGWADRRDSTLSARRIWVSFSHAYPWKNIFAAAWIALRG
jgi:hypothetical protein